MDVFSLASGGNAVAGVDKNGRQFDRHNLQFDVEIFDATTGQLLETARLQDVSGTGACFLSARPGSYLPGQEIALEIHLPGTDTLSAHMHGHGSIVWIADRPQPDEERWAVGVDLASPLRFLQEKSEGEQGAEGETE